MNRTRADIQIFKPFGEAFELMQKILFQPFDLSKWCVIGFAAFLATLGGSGYGFQFNTRDWQNHNSLTTGGFRSFIEQITPGWWILSGIGVICFGALILVCMWIGARGRFVFADCVVRNRAAIVEPWKQYRHEGNSFFLFLLAAAGVIILVLLALMLLVVLAAMHVEGDHGRAAVIAGVLVMLAVFPPLFIFGTLMPLVVPVMYRQRCKTWPAFRQLLNLLWRHPGVFVLYFLFSIVLGLGTILLMVLAMCLTCCIALIPYVGTVIFLPVLVVWRAFSLLFLRQFGVEYDVWNGQPPMDPASPPALPA